MRIINIVDSVEKINYGIWHAATANAGLLAMQGVQTELWYPAAEFDLPNHVTGIALSSRSLAGLQNALQTRNLNPQGDIIITHGAWQFPTRWGAWLKKKGFVWIYVPHGMLDPWALRQKRIKKALYLNLVEKRLAKRADLIKAVSLPESNSLEQFFKPSSIRFIPNGVAIDADESGLRLKQHPRRYLFLSRLHAKKNVLTLANAWLQSGLNNNKAYELLIAGPDQGELEKLKPLLKNSDNMKYMGSVYGEKKKELLQQSTFYVLPSFSEGLPSSLLEAMSYKIVPIITDECNLQEVFTQKLGVRITTDENNIMYMLEQTAGWDLQTIADWGERSGQFIKDHYSLEAISDVQMTLFSKLLHA